MTKKNFTITERDFMIKKLQLLPEMIKGSEATIKFMKLILEYFADRDGETLNYYLDNYPIIIADETALLKKWTKLCSITIEEFNKLNTETINNPYNGKY